MRILIVEDTEDNRTILRDLFQSVGYTVIEATTGEEGVAAAERERPDLILMDIQLPIIDGYEATRRIKAISGLSRIPVIAVIQLPVLLDVEAVAKAIDDSHDLVRITALARLCGAPKDALFGAPRNTGRADGMGTGGHALAPSCLMKGAR